MSRLEASYVFRHSWIDSSRAPIYVAVLPHNVTAQSVEVPLREYETFLRERPHALAWVMVVSGLDDFDADTRQVVVASEKRMRDLELRWNAGQAFVLRKPLHRLLLSALQCMAPPAYAHRTFASTDEAIVWAGERLKRFQAISDVG